ncbi:MAG: hypothetical protein IOC92_08840 [Rhodobacter sp.]|nr:hypothetical protein [Rhodobacter sp.]MCA3461477.1 hypothetical protein [Rhodobacter sp.]MCA3464392.1 hypothetical protein [Rhodobacter sp.]MCA3466569.1 hypothetical protein [Rhodobacter sp.]MCA3470156.1 hypothetical protein [Rhodobacter sp.]
MKMTKAVQSFALKAASGKVRSYCRKTSAPMTVVSPATTTQVRNFVRQISKGTVQRNAAALAAVIVTFPVRCISASFGQVGRQASGPCPIRFGTKAMGVTLSLDGANPDGMFDIAYEYLQPSSAAGSPMKLLATAPCHQGEAF